MTEKTNRTNLKDLTVDEHVLSAEDMDQVQGGKNYYENRSNEKTTDPATSLTTSATVNPVSTSSPTTAPKDWPITPTPKTQKPL